MAQRSVEGISHQTVAHGVQAGQPRLAHTFAADRESSFMKAGYGKTVRPVCAADGGKLFIGRLLRPDSWETDEQSGAIRRGVGGAKGRDRGECGPTKHAPDSEPGKRDTGCWLAYGNLLPLLPEVGAACGKAARADLCGGHEATRVPTAKGPLRLADPRRSSSWRHHRSDAQAGRAPV